jgi:hypothetical protein
MNIRVSLILGVVLAVGVASIGSAVDLKGKAPKAPGAKAGSAPAKAADAEESDDGTQFALNDSGKTATHDCKGGQAAINGNKNNVKLKNCSQTSLNGNNNTLDVTGVETLAVAGNDNIVTWHSKPGADEPAIADGGSRNKITGK